MEIQSLQSYSPRGIHKRSCPPKRLNFGTIIKNNASKVLKMDATGIKDKFVCIVSGPSGSGKDSILNAFDEKYGFFSRVVNCTTRAPRVGEINGVNYNFLTNDEFQKGIKDGDFLEYVNVYADKFYGTRKKDVDSALAQGKNVVITLDVEGAMQVKQERPDALMLFITPPSLEELFIRLVNRGTETMDAIKERIGKASYEMQFKDKYDVVLQNDNLAESVNELAQILKVSK